MTMALGATRLIFSPTDSTIPALVFTRSSRLIPGLRAMPAVTTKSSEPGGGVVVVGTDHPGIEAFDRAGLPLVERLALGNALDHVHHHHRAGQVLLGHALGRRGADVAGPDDRDLVEHA